MLEVWSALGPLLPGILVLLLISAFFSGSEAAFFSLNLSQRREMSKGSPAERTAFALLEKPERLLMGILFWNLATNITYFSLVSRGSIRLENALQEPQATTAAAGFAFASLMLIILVGEFFPKSVAVLRPRLVSSLVAFPLSLTVRVLDGILPTMRFINEVSRRIIWPGFKPEPYLETSDLERAIELSSDGAQLFEQERQVLRNVVQLRDIRVEEWMRPRTQFRSFAPPLSLEQLGGELPPSRYMLVTDKKGKDLVAAIDITSVIPRDTADLAKLKKSLVVVPWCSNIADALRKLRDADRRVAVVVNEFGETIGVLTWEDIFEAILQLDSVPSHRELARGDIQVESPGVWIATGMTSLRRLERVIGKRLSDTKNLTIGGVLQEDLKRLAEPGDQCVIDDIEIEVIETGRRGEILVRLRVGDSPKGEQ
jgi:putative hemolysin